MKYDFGGWATKSDILCADGRVIKPGAFEHQDGQRVPLVYQHNRNNLDNIIGFADLEDRNEGVYAYGLFNETREGRHAKECVKHGDISCLSIFANNLTQNGRNVTHGTIREVSLVMAPANPGAVIDNLIIEHSADDIEILEHSAFIYSGEEIDTDPDILEHAVSSKKDALSNKKIEDEENKEENAKEDDDMTIEDIINTMNDDQKKALYYLIGQALGEDDTDTEDSADDDEEDKTSKVKHSVDFNESEDVTMKVNPFEKPEENSIQHSITEEQFTSIVNDAKKIGSFKEAFLEHAQEYGIENIDTLFPDAKTLTSDPAIMSRNNEWVADVLKETHHVPFSRVKGAMADVTADEARARGYTKGNRKKEEVIRLLKRVTFPTTVYKKQKLDRDDILDITDLNIVAWLKAEMRVMLNEEIARAFLIGDGRDPGSEDKINEESIRPIWTDDDLYVENVVVSATATPSDIVDAVVRSRKSYRGSGSPTLYTTSDNLVDMLLMVDKIGRRLYNNEAELASALRVKRIVEVPVMENQSRTVEGAARNLVGIIVNLKDYTVGADRGGDISMFDDFDIDYNQYKYLMEARMSGALVQPKSAIVIEKLQGTGADLG